MLLVCAVLFQDAYIVDAPMRTLWQEVRVSVCQEWSGAFVTVEGRIYEEVQDDQREVQKWTEIARRRLTVAVEP